MIHLIRSLTTSDAVQYQLAGQWAGHSVECRHQCECPQTGAAWLLHYSTTPLLHPHNQLEQSADVQAAPPSQGRAGQLWALQQIFTFQPSNSQLYIENNFPAAPLPFKPWHQSTLTQSDIQSGC